MSVTVPDRLVRFIPDGHAYRFHAKDDVEAKKPVEKRNPNASGGLNRRDWLVCACGHALRIEGGGEPSEQEWLDLVNQCRLAVHSEKRPCLPVTMDGQEQPVREAPPAPTVAPSLAEPDEPSVPRRAGRAKKLVEA